MPLNLKFYNILEILICLLDFLNALNHSEYPSPTIVSFLAEKVVVLVSKFDDFELICSFSFIREQIQCHLLPEKKH